MRLRFLHSKYWYALALAAFALPSFAVEQTSERLYAAPNAAAAAAKSSGGSIGQVTLALAVVLALVFVAAWLLRHARKLNLSGSVQKLEVIAQVSLGAKERAVLLRVNNTQVLVGVAPGHVTSLLTFPTSDVTSGDAKDAGTLPTITATAPSFKSLLKKSLGLS